MTIYFGGKFSCNAEGYTGTATNRRANATVTDVVWRGYFAATFGDLALQPVVQIGDVFEIRVVDSAGHLIAQPTTRPITPEMLETAFISVVLDVAPGPTTTLLLQNSRIRSIRRRGFRINSARHRQLLSLSMM